MNLNRPVPFGKKVSKVPVPFDRIEIIERMKKMKEKIAEIKANAKEDIKTITDMQTLQEIKNKYLGKKCELTALLKTLGSLSPEERPIIGNLVNETKQEIESFIKEKEIEFKKAEINKKIEKETVDITLPSTKYIRGSKHPVNRMIEKLEDVFVSMGYDVVDGPELETDEFCFERLNLPDGHPARDMQDTFFVSKDEGRQQVALRTHTSSVQVRVMEHATPPIRIIAPGRVYRNEAISARAHCIFHQVEALYVDKKVTFADLKQTLLYFAKEMFGEQTQIRLRPSYFPFTEPSAEMDISCNICGGKGCNICKGTGWLEILGCGMVDPNVLRSCGIDPDQYSGFALGMGVERMTMLKYQIRDLRLYFENDLRFLKQFDAIV